MNPEQDAAHRLILLRHAKSQWPDGMLDPDRPLAERGIADATATGPILAGITEFTEADVVLCSPAVRTRATWRLVSQALPNPPTTRFEPLVYGASPAELIDLIRTAPAQARTVLVVGHEPTMSTTAELLAGPGSQQEDLARLRAKYPTSAMAIFAVATDWSSVQPGSAVLERFLIPRG
ncbi:MAG TPA: histidine phosphatase family protein [Kineosporiaceae bacterium]|nr:histidine phosphatase family protein [Kineosporiaceae bacterium]